MALCVRRDIFVRTLANKYNGPRSTERFPKWKLLYFAAEVSYVTDAGWRTLKAVLTELKVIWESTNPRESNRRFFDRYVTLPFADMIQRASVKCKQLPVYGVFWQLLPHSSTDSNETRTCSSLTPKEPSLKIWYKSVHNFFSYRGHRQTHRHTNQRRWKHIPSLSRG